MQAGLDSLGAVELCNALGARFRLELGATAIFDYPTVQSLAGHLSSYQQAVSIPDAAVPVKADVLQQVHDIMHILGVDVGPSQVCTVACSQWQPTQS